MMKNHISPSLKTHFLNLYSIALSDLNIDTKELELLYEFGKRRGIGKEEINSLILNANKIKFTIPESLEERIEYLYDFAIMIWIDGKVEDFEKKYLVRFCRIFGFVEEQIEAIAEFLLEEAKKGTKFQELLSLIKNNNQENI